MWWLKSLKSVNTPNNGVKAFSDVCLTKTGKSQFYSWTLLLTSCEIRHKPSWCSKPLLCYLYNGNNNIHLLCLSRTVYPKELWRVELCRCVVAISPIGMFCCFKSLIFTHWGCSVICVPMWVKVEGLCRILLARSFGKGESPGQRRKHCFGEKKKKKHSHGVKKKKKNWSIALEGVGAQDAHLWEQP